MAQLYEAVTCFLTGLVKLHYRSLWRPKSSRCYPKPSKGFHLDPASGRIN